MELYVVISEKKYFNECEYDYVYIIELRYVVRRCCLLSRH